MKFSVEIFLYYFVLFKEISPRGVQLSSNDQNEESRETELRSITDLDDNMDIRKLFEKLKSNHII